MKLLIVLYFSLYYVSVHRFDTKSRILGKTYGMESLWCLQSECQQQNSRCKWRLCQPTADFPQKLFKDRNLLKTVQWNILMVLPRLAISCWKCNDDISSLKTLQMCTRESICSETPSRESCQGTFEAKNSDERPDLASVNKQKSICCNFFSNSLLCTKPLKSR